MVTRGTSAGADSIYFAIPGYGVHTINVGSAYALITGSVTIDAYSQPGSQVNTETATDNAVLAVELNGTSAGASVSGLDFDTTSDNSRVSGLVINRFNGWGINAGGLSGDKVAGLRISGNFNGTELRAFAAHAGLESIVIG